MPQEVKILKIRLDKTTLEDAAAKIMHWLSEKKQHMVVTPNPEIVLEAQKNPKFQEILNKANLNIPDGIGLLWAASYLHSTSKNGKLIKFLKWIGSLFTIIFYPKYLRKVLPCRVTGVDLMEKIISETTKNKEAIFLLGAETGVAEKTKEILEKKYPYSNIVGTFAGTPDEKDEKNILEKINKVSPDIIFVAYGAPKQEIWIFRNLPKMKSVKVAIGVGGAFDFISGEKKRAPKILQKIGLEWLYRLIKEPSRLKRIGNATIKFPVTVLRKNLKSPNNS